MSPLMTSRIAVKALARNKMRTALTMLGMIIGVAAVIAMIALGTGAQMAIEEQIRNAGTNMITVLPGSRNMGGVNTGSGTVRMRDVDAQALRLIPDLEYVSEVVRTGQQVLVDGENWYTTILGVNTDYQGVKSWRVQEGGFFTDHDVETAAKVCLLGYKVAEELFPDGRSPVGEALRIRGHLFRVLGVLAPRGSSSSGEDQDDQILAPYTTIQKKLQGRDWLSYMLVSASAADTMDRAKEAIRTELRFRYGLLEDEDDTFYVSTQDDMVAARTQQTRTMTALLAGIAGVSLVVGGIGIMNIMLVSVTERTREIGLRLAIGARARDVLRQFLIEAIVIAIFGGTAGIVLGYWTAELLEVYLNSPTMVPPDSIATAVGFSAAVGIFFGFYPARKASALDPIDALRFEQGGSGGTKSPS